MFSLARVSRGGPRAASPLAAAPAQKIAIAVGTESMMRISVQQVCMVWCPPRGRVAG